jgi:hypothetical protein
MLGKALVVFEKIKHLPPQLMLKQEKYFMKLVSHRTTPEDTIISLAPCGDWRPL